MCAEKALPRFYENVAEKLKAWQPAPPKLGEKKLSEEAERTALDEA